MVSKFEKRGHLLDVLISGDIGTDIFSIAGANNKTTATGMQFFMTSKKDNAKYPLYSKQQKILPHNVYLYATRTVPIILHDLRQRQASGARV